MSLRFPNDAALVTEEGKAAVSDYERIVPKNSQIFITRPQRVDGPPMVARQLLRVQHSRDGGQPRGARQPRS